jgi:hypothetical protein
MKELDIIEAAVSSRRQFAGLIPVSHHATFWRLVDHDVHKMGTIEAYEESPSL